MATYFGSYLNDRGRLYKGISLRIYSIVNEEFTTTTPELDDEITPSIWFDELTFRDPSIAACGPIPIVPRKAECVVSNGLTYYFDCPFIGGSNKFIQFFTELVNSRRYRIVNLVGERVGLRQASDYFR